VDDALVGYLATPGSQDIANEFGVKPDPRRKEWQVITAWLNDSNFNGTTGAQNTLLTAPSWDVVCRERMIFYANFKRAAN
jgi:hypothetical protein